MFAPNDLDFYVRKFADCQAFRKYLFSMEYSLLLEPDAPLDSRYSSRLIERVETFHHSKKPRGIQVVYSFSQAALAPILDFDSTLLMNFVSADCIVSFHPDLTLQNMGKRLSKSDRALQLFSKYYQRGFRSMPQTLWEQENTRYDWNDSSSSGILCFPSTGLHDAFSESASWILPFIPADGNEEESAKGFWFEERDDFGKSCSTALYHF